MSALPVGREVAYVSRGIGYATVGYGVIVGYAPNPSYAKVEDEGRVYYLPARDLYIDPSDALAAAAAIPTMGPAEMAAAHGYGQGRYTGD